MKYIANMDQTPLSTIVMIDEKTCADKGRSELWCSTHGACLHKKQYSVQLTILADGKPRGKPLVNFWGKGLRINSKEQDGWD